MAEPKGGSAGGDKKGRKPHKNKPTSKKYKHYTISGDTIKKTKTCPRCGPGTFLAQHKDRLACGKCKYTEFTIKQKVIGWLFFVLIFSGLFFREACYLSLKF